MNAYDICLTRTTEELHTKNSQQTLRDKKLESYDVQGARGIDTRF